jgi:hypothetical protein
MLIIVSENKHGGRFRATLEDSTPLVKSSRTPLLDSARILLRQGIDPNTRLVMRHKRGSPLDGAKSVIPSSLQRERHTSYHSRPPERHTSTHTSPGRDLAERRGSGRSRNPPVQWPRDRPEHPARDIATRRVTAPGTPAPSPQLVLPDPQMRVVPLRKRPLLAAMTFRFPPWVIIHD